MTKLLNKSLFCWMFLVWLFAALDAAWSCSCAILPVTDPQKWLKDFDGAVFRGTLVKTKVIDRTREMTFEVEEVWKGIEKSEVTVLSHIGGCGVEYLDQTSFVVADNFNGTLRTSLCTYVIDESKVRELGKGRKPKRN